jgi:hypothetical protein
MSGLKPRCFDCTFWHEDTKEAGECRRHAPAALHVNGSGTPHGQSAAWPATRSEDWCGDFLRVEDR